MIFFKRIKLLYIVLIYIYDYNLVLMRNKKKINFYTLVYFSMS